MTGKKVIPRKRYEQMLKGLYLLIEKVRYDKELSSSVAVSKIQDIEKTMFWMRDNLDPAQWGDDEEAQAAKDEPAKTIPD